MQIIKDRDKNANSNNKRKMSLSDSSKQDRFDMKYKDCLPYNELHLNTFDEY